VLITDGEAALPAGVAAWKAATGSRLFALLVGRHRAGRPDLQAGADRAWALADVLDDGAALDLFGEV